MELNCVEFGIRMAKKRKELGMKQYELCEALNTTPNYLLLGISETDRAVNLYISEKVYRLTKKQKNFVNDFIEILTKYD